MLLTGSSPVKILISAVRMTAILYTTIPAKIPTAIKIAATDNKTCFNIPSPFVNSHLGKGIIMGLSTAILGKKAQAIQNR